MSDLQTTIREKFNNAKHNTSDKSSNKVFVGMNGEKNSDNVLKKMVDKII